MCATPTRKVVVRLVMGMVLVSVLTAPARADELWVPPTYQADVGGLGVGNNTFWPVSPFAFLRLAFAVPDDLAAFQSATLVLIPEPPGGAATLNICVCAAQDSAFMGAACVGPVGHPFMGVVDQLHEIDISGAIAPHVGAPGLNYLAIVAYTIPTAGSDRILGPPGVVGTPSVEARRPGKSPPRQTTLGYQFDP